MKKVVSASRRTDMAATDPDGLTHVLVEKAPPSQTHTLVLWTKNPHNILYHPALSSQLIKYDQCYIHLTVTGLAGTVLEPNVPASTLVLSYLPQLIEFTHGPERINFRFDPIVHVRFANGSTLCNLPFFEQLAPVLQRFGIQHVTTSWVQIYGKVAKRLAARGITATDISQKTWEQERVWLLDKAQEHHLELHGCCVPGMPRSHCIDGAMFNRLHPVGSYKATTTRASGQRVLCGCSKSLDVGWYKSCIHGCLYCYGNPQIKHRKNVH